MMSKFDFFFGLKKLSLFVFNPYNRYKVLRVLNIPQGDPCTIARQLMG